MIKQKKIYLLMTIAVILLSLAACNRNDETGIQILTESTAQPEYLSFFSPTSLSNTDVTKYWRERFTEQYNKQVYINFDAASYYADNGLSYRELLENRLQSSAPDDLYIINAEDVLEFEQRGYWMDLSDMDFVNHLSEAALYQSTYNGKVFSLPLSFTGFGFIWNIDLLKEYDLEIPQNQPEFLTVCAKLKDAGILPYGANKGYALTVPAMCVGLSPLYGGSDLEEQIAALNSGERPISDYLREGYDFLSLMIENGYLDPQQALAATPNVDDVALFLSGQCAFISVGLGTFYPTTEIPFQIEVTGLPVLEDGYISVYGAARRLCVNPNSKHLDTTLQFIEMVGSPEALAISASLDYTLSSAKINEATCLPVEESLVIQLQQPGQIPNQDFALHFNTWESIRNVARELCAGISVDQACDLLDEKQQTDLAEYGQNTQPDSTP